ncbi:MAG: hypothetical protein ACRD96_19265, partial [Bryobacteraceae bacterium]
ATRWLAAAFTVQITLSLVLATVNYQHWDGYRAFAASLAAETANRRVWVNGEWLGYYFEAAGALPLVRGQAVRPGEIVVSSQLAYPVEFTTGGGARTPLAEREIRPDLPLRLIAIDTRSAYSTVKGGYWPFDISTAPIDRVRADLVVERAPALSRLSMAASETAHQIVSGVHELEDNRFRWTSARALILLKSPAAERPLRAVFRIHDRSPARRVSMLLDGVEVAAQSFPGPGLYSLESTPLKPGGPAASVALVVDRAFSVPGDRRELSLVLVEVGFVESNDQRP